MVGLRVIRGVARMPAAWRLRVLQQLAQWGFREETLLLVLAVIIGLASGTAAWVFKWLVEFLTRWLYEAPAFAWHATVYLFLLPLLPALGGLLMSGIRVLFRSGKSPFHGLTNVLLSLIRTGGKLPHKTGLETLLTSSLTIGSGGSAGPEAPIAIIGSSIGSSLGVLAGISRRYLPTLVGCGAAAGIGAVFDAPIAGVLFALEVMLRDFSVRTFTPIVIAAVVSTTWFHSLIQARPGQPIRGLFELGANKGGFVFTFHELPYYVLLGLLCGFLAIVFTFCMNQVEKASEHLRPVPRFFRPALGALLSGICGVLLILLFRQDPIVQHRFAESAYVPVYGSGYATILRAIDPSWYAPGAHIVDGRAVTLYVGFLVAVCLLKVLATSLTLGSGGSGGVFAPALFIGATAGGGFGLALRQFVPQAPPNAYALVAMGAVLAAVIQAPLMAILLLFEITRNYQVMLPIMLAAVIATVVYQFAYGDSVYTLPLRAKGIRVGSAAGMSALRRISIDQLAIEEAPIIDVSEPLEEILARSQDTGVTDYVVVQETGRYLGILSMAELHGVLLAPEAAPLLLVGEVCRPDVPPLQSTDTLETALDLFARHDVNHLAVIRPGKPQIIAGVLSRAEAIRKYQHILGQ